VSAPALGRVAAALLLAGGAAAESPGDDSDLLGFLAGRYEVIGRLPDSTATYSGTLELRVEGEALAVERTIAGERTRGRARVEHRTADRIAILVAELTRDGRPLEAECAIGSDLDNGPRLTCRVRERGTQPAAPGLEAWFFAPRPAG
jgi:hypothetical protein